MIHSFSTTKIVRLIHTTINALMIARATGRLDPFTYVDSLGERRHPNPSRV